jgi:phospholipase/carboxylesterase
VKEFPLPEGLSLRFIFPHAPMRAVTINGGNVMRAWYDIAMTDIARLPDERGIRESQAQVNVLIAREESRGVPASTILSAGFSQGGAIALQAALRHPKKLAGVMALSTYLTLADTLAAEASPANRDTPILMAHGTQDPVVPLKLAASSRDKLVELGWKVEWREYPMPHSVCMEEVEEIAGWLADRFTSRILIA